MELMDSESRRRNSTTRRKKRLNKNRKDGAQRLGKIERTEPRGSVGLESSERGQ